MADNQSIKPIDIFEKISEINIITNLESLNLYQNKSNPIHIDLSSEIPSEHSTFRLIKLNSS